MIAFKHEKDKELFTGLNIILVMIYADLAVYAKEKYGIDLVITQTISTEEEDALLGRVSDAHQKAIALDIRANNLDPVAVKGLCDYINNEPRFKKYHYQARSGAKRLAYDHGKGANYHIHLQIHQKYAIEAEGRLAQN